MGEIETSEYIRKLEKRIIRLENELHSNSRDFWKGEAVRLNKEIERLKAEKLKPFGEARNSCIKTIGKMLEKKHRIPEDYADVVILEMSDNLKAKTLAVDDILSLMFDIENNRGIKNRYSMWNELKEALAGRKEGA